MGTMIENQEGKAYTFEEYKQHFVELVAQGKTTGLDQSQGLVEYTKNNWLRFNRMLERVIPLDQVKNQRPIQWVVLVEAWCGDATHILPVLHILAQHIEHVEMHILLRDENPVIMNQHLTNGGKAIPKLIIQDAKTKQVLNTWGPRPAKAQQIVAMHKQKENYDKQAMTADLYKFYIQNRGEEVIREVLEIMKPFMK